MGAAYGMAAWPQEWVEGLADAKGIAVEADALAAAASSLATPASSAAAASEL